VQRSFTFKILDEIAAGLGKSRSQVALNWLLQQDSVVVIPKAVERQHVRENAGAAGLKLHKQDYDRLSKAFS
jgi:diketogulonate reductase-like aldo/keto reductase